MSSIEDEPEALARAKDAKESKTSNFQHRAEFTSKNPPNKIEPSISNFDAYSYFHFHWQAKIKKKPTNDSSEQEMSRNLSFKTHF